MAISREEIDEIAKVVAERVVSIAHPCYCGWAVWEVGDTLGQLSENLRYKKGESLEANKPHIIAVLERIENTCVVDMTEPKSHLKDIYERVQRRDWDYASGALHELDESIGNKLRSQITKGSNPGPKRTLREIITEYKGYRIKEYHYPEGFIDWWVTDPDGKLLGLYFSLHEAEKAVDTALLKGGVTDGKPGAN